MSVGQHLRSPITQGLQCRLDYGQRSDHVGLELQAGALEAGVLEKVPYQERPLRHEYRLTDKGLDLWPVLTTMREWGDRWAAPDGAPLELVHDVCGEVMFLTHTCRACGEPFDRRSVHARPGPGARLNDFARTPLAAGT